MLSGPRIAIKRALISVSDKGGVVDFARKLVGYDVEILCTGETAGVLQNEGVPAISVGSYTGFPEIMDSRVETLHPKIHGALLAVRDSPEHVRQMKENGIEPINMVVVNLRPFEQTLASPGITVEDVIERIEIGGVAMLRSAAKNHRYVTVIVDPADYEVVATELDANRAVSFETRKRLAVKAFRHSAAYDAAIDAYLCEIYKIGK